jgi:hypothetical protein
MMFAYADTHLSGDLGWVYMRKAQALTEHAVSIAIQHRATERERRSKGGKSRAAKARAMPAWMIEVFDRAYEDRIGHVNLLGVAWRMAGPKHPDRHQLTEHRARQYLKSRRKRPAEN